MIFTEYNSATGQLGGTHGGYSTSSEALAQVFWPGMNAVIEGQHNPRTHYIHNGQPTPRPASPISRSGLTLSNVPTGATLTIDGTHYSAQGTVALNFPLPGTYALRVECFPYLDFVDEVTV